jgi:DNA-binding Lrp family transcriptional regulator
MKKRMWNLLLEYLKDSKRSDRELAGILGVSQPTVTRMRNKMVQDGVIQEFTIIPDFMKMGFRIMAITFTKTKFDPELTERAKKSAMAKPNIVLCAFSQGLGMNGIIVSLHRDYSEYSDFLTNYMIEWRDVIEDHDCLLVSLGGTIIKPFSLKYLAELEEK